MTAPDAPARGPRRHWVNPAIGAALAIVAAIWHAMLMTRATNDNFLHLTLAQQWLHGDWPVRDFFDQGWVLQYSLSALAQLVLGERIGSEALIVGIAWAIAVYLMFMLTVRLTGSSVVGVVCGVLPIVASARGYSYPKGIVYAAAAWLWWDYVDQPTVRRAVILGLWTAVAFYWRPDHGVYVAIAVILAMVAAHGVRPLALARCVVAGATTVACIIPFLIYVQAVYGLQWYARTGLVTAQVEHESQGTHEWPLLRYGFRILAVESADHYAPIVGLRWHAGSSADERASVRRKYGLTITGEEPGGVELVRLSASAIPQVRTLINEPLIDDTAGIDRSAGVITDKDWPAADRRKYKYPFLRLQVLPSLDATERASEITGALFLLFPLLTLIGGWWMASRLHGRTGLSLAAFSLFALLVALAMIRNPFQARVADAVVLSSICFGCALGALWNTGGRGSLLTLGVRAVLVAASAAVVMCVGQSGRFEGPVSWARSANESSRELLATPPLAYYVDRPARFTLRLAAYVRECVPATDRLLVLWFEPEIYYYSDRLMAQRHLVFASLWSELEHEQRATLDKIDRFTPPLVLARRSALDEYARATFPGVIDYVNRNYALATTVQDGGEDYLIYARRDRAVSRTFGAGSWPCYSQQPTLWSRVGQPSS